LAKSSRYIKEKLDCSEISNMSRRIYAKKSLGQNFLIDKRVKTKIVKNLYLNDKDIVVEVGPGKGALTEIIYNKVNNLIAVEYDDYLYSDLKSRYDNTNIKIINADAKLIDISNYLENGTSYKFVGNLPYNVANKIILNFLKSVCKPEFMIVMLQLEVAKRIAGHDKFGGYLTVIIGIYCASEILFTVKPSSFKPKPKINSAVVKLTPYKKPKIDQSNIEKFSAFVSKSFISRRKTILNNLSSGNQISKDLAIKILEDANIDSKIRPQNLSVDDWVKLYFSIIKNK
tara:strand:- start:267 stop:1124 length:858 start_codon:yes stop_codon:yes gene_type:complete